LMRNENGPRTIPLTMADDGGGQTATHR